LTRPLSRGPDTDLPHDCCRPTEVVLRAFSLQELARATEFVEPVHAVLDRDPAREIDSGEQPEDRVVVVQSRAGFAVPQDVRVAGGPVARLERVERGTGREIAIGGVNRHDAGAHPLEKADGIVAADDGVGGIVLDAEEWRLDLIDDLHEDVFGLGELRVPPPAVLVVILHAEGDAASFGVFERAPDPLDRPRDAFGSRHAGQTLAAQRAAVARSETHGQVDRRLLPFDLPRPFVRVGMGEVG